MAAAKHRAIDVLRRNSLRERKHEQLGHELETEQETAHARPRRRHRRSTSATICSASSSSPATPSFPPRHASRSPCACSAASPPTRSRARSSCPSRPSPSASSAPSARSRDSRVPFEVPRGRRARGASRLGARGHLPDLQRRLLGHRRRGLDAARALRGRAAPRPHPGRARAAASPRCTGSSR